MDTIVGIDLGTTNSLVAVCDARGPRILLDEQGQGLVPSVVRIMPEADAPADVNSTPPYRVMVGALAKAQAPMFPASTIASVKRLMGRSLADAAKDLPYLSYQVVAGERETCRVRVPRENGPPLDLSPEEVSARVLARLKEIAEKALGQGITKAVITVPAYFDDAQRQATRTAGRLAGLEVVRILPEPTAAALAYGLGLRTADKDKPSQIVVYDLGGGTFDVSVLRLTPSTDPSEPFFFQVLSTSGDTRLGGDDFDHLLVDLFLRGIAQEMGAASPEEVSLPAESRRALLALAESVKIRLSDHASAAVAIDLGGGRRYERTVTRAEFETLIAPLVEKTIESCRAALRDAARALGEDAIGAVVMVGGSTRVPLVRERVAAFFGIEPYTAIDPDLVVALGASVQAAIVSGARRDALLLDVIPLSLGIETVGGAVAKLVMRNSTLPAKATETFSTSVDNQTAIKLSVYQGEREMAADCRKLAELTLRGLPPMPAGIPQLVVQFLVDVSGVLNVSAHERRSGARASLQVVPNFGLTSEEVEKIERESLTHAREDMTRHRVVDLIANSRLDLKWISQRYELLKAELEPAYRDDLAAKMTTVRDLIAQAESDWQAVNPDAFYRAKEALDRGSMRLQEISIKRSLEQGP